jgi:hypothetical protein
MKSNISQPKDLTKIGKQNVSVKVPKAKKPADAFSNPSTFFKSEENEPKHPSLRNLWDFLNKKHKK